MADILGHASLAEALRERIKGAEGDERLTSVAHRALDESRVQLMMAFRFLDRALWKMPNHPGECSRFFLATDGRELVFDPAKLTRAYRDDPSCVARAHLHALLHCIFRHPLHTVRADPQAWELACDICVESIAVELCAVRFALEGDEGIARTVAALEKEDVPLTPTGVYRALLLWRKNPVQNPLLQDLAAGEESARKLFARDSHELWDLATPRQNDKDVAPQESPGDEGEGDGADVSTRQDSSRPPRDEHESATGEAGNDAPGDLDDTREEQGEGTGRPQDNRASEASRATEGQPRSGHQTKPGSDDAAQEWEAIAEQVRAGLRDGEHHGAGSSRLSDNLTLANRSRVDYSDFLRRFATCAEELKVNDEEFDYLFYTYGLSQYGNVAIVEPLEYKDDRGLREFAIAIDTSGSCSSGLTRAFVTRTCEILSQACADGERMNVHIIECDAEVQSDTVITCMNDLRAYEREFEVRGFGGTDFRPVFDYVNSLVASNAFRDLRGLVYFTDGFGTFPEQAPDFDVAFVFVERAGKQRRVPPWAMKVIMGEEDLEMLEGGGAWTSAKQNSR